MLRGGKRVNGEAIGGSVGPVTCYSSSGCFLLTSHAVIPASFGHSAKPPHQPSPIALPTRARTKRKTAHTFS